MAEGKILFKLDGADYQLDLLPGMTVAEAKALNLVPAKATITEEWEEDAKRPKRKKKEAADQ